MEVPQSVEVPGPAYAPVTPWSPLAATLATIVVVVASIALSVAPFLLMPALAKGGVSPQILLATTIISQAVMGLGGWWLAGTRGGVRREVLSLRPIGLSAGKIVLALVAMFAVTSGYQTFRYYVLGHDVFTDMRVMLPLFQHALWPLAFIVVALGAPLAEEILFRGFLQSAFPRSTFGFWAGVAIATLMWTVLHAQYGLPALGLIAIMGVMFAAMLRWRGSLRLPILAHAANNTVASLALLYMAWR